ncbi:MAG: putative baseplate assembly protein [Calditrichaeota bacterium]|nr:MAG: putative baseplate assembly protein [Calditrichota bacterium]
MQEARVAVEDLGTGNGEPDQTYFLSNTPVIIDPPEKTQLSINGVIWTRVDDLYTAMEEVEEMAKVKSQDSQATSRVYTLDRASGQVKFGDGRWGARPPLGAKIQARYSYGGGNSGNVAIDVINKGAALPPGVKVRNPIKASGGADSESVADAERRIPSFLKHRNRLVTAPDFKDIAERTPGVEMGRVDVLPLFNPELPKVLSAGVVTLMVIPQNDPLHPEAPQPDQEFLTNVCDYLDPRRLVTTEVYVRGPKYKDIFITIGLEVVPGEQFAPVRETVIAQIKKFLSPLEGGREGTGWPRDRALVAAELLAEVTRVKGVAFVNQAYISDSVGATMESIAFSGLYLPRIAHIGVRLGDADLPGTGYTDTGDDESGTTLTTINPIPLIPETC